MVTKETANEYVEGTRVKHEQPRERAPLGNLTRQKGASGSLPG